MCEERLATACHAPWCGLVCRIQTKRRDPVCTLRYTLFRAGYNKGRVVRAIELTRGVHHSTTCFSNDDGGCCQVPAVKAELVIGISSTRGQVAECQSGAPNDADPGSEGRMWVSGRGHALTWRAQGVSPSVPHLLVGTLHTQK